MNQHEDQRYIIALREGNTSLINEIYKRYSRQVIQWVQKNNGTVSDAKDVFQEAILSIFNKASDPDFILTYPLGSLLFTICKNKWLDQIRKKSRVSEVRKEAANRLYDTDSGLEPLIEQMEEAEIKDNKLAKAFSQLSDLCQQLLTLIAKGDKPNEVAIHLQMNNANTVYRRKNACIERWRTLFHEERIV